MTDRLDEIANELDDQEKNRAEMDKMPEAIE